MNKVISREYVEQNYIHKDVIKEYMDSKIDELSKIYNNSEDGIEREIAKGMAVFATMMKKEMLEKSNENNNTINDKTEKEQSANIHE